MKYFIIVLFLSHSVFAGYSKPELMARYSGINSWNISESSDCSRSSPLVVNDRVYLACIGSEGSFMASWDPKFKKIISSKNDRFFSSPVVFMEKISWYEFDETGVRRSFQLDEGVEVTELKDLAPALVTTDSFLPFSKDKWIYRVNSGGYTLWAWSLGQVTPLFTQEFSHLFPPLSDPNGGLLVKTRENSTSESGPDRLWYGKSELKVIFEDQDANPRSKWRSFRHQMDVSGGEVVMIATDSDGEALVLANQNSLKIIARTGLDVRSFDYFSPKINKGVVAFRGVDLNGRKAVWVFCDDKLERLVTEGDIVHTDQGLARVSYSHPDAIFFGPPGVGPKGEIVQQMALTDYNYPKTVLGIGLVKFHKH